MKFKTPESVSMPDVAKKHTGSPLPRPRRESLLKRMEKEFIEREQHLLAVANSVQDAIVSADSGGNIIFWNEGAHRNFGYEESEIIGQPLLKILPERFRKAHSEGMKRFMKTGEKRVIGRVVELAGLHKDGSEFPIELSLGVWETERGKYFTGIMRNISERVRSETALRDSENRLRTLLDSMIEGLVQADCDEKIEFVNDRLCLMLGYERCEILGKTTYDLVFDKDDREVVREANANRLKGVASDYEVKLKKKSGEMLYVIVGGAPLTNGEGEVIGSMGVFTDISERKRAENQLLHDALHDGLTGLANRALFMDHLRRTIERSRSVRSSKYAVLFLDFDRFKVVNDSLGHHEGDELLRQIARRLQASTRTADLTARLGGDEFVILINDLSNADEALLVAKRILSDLKTSFNLSGREIFISASIGIALSTAGHQNAEDMLRDADIAMYRAKSKGKAQFQVFDHQMHEQASRQFSIESEMRIALERGEFELHYQPIINLKNGKLKGFESLVRWRHPERGMIPPLEFISAAEENGLIIPLGEWIICESCRQMKNWHDLDLQYKKLTISVNLSAKQFTQLDLTERITEILEETGLDPACLRLEITESELMQNNETAIVVMNRLHALGIRWSLDDFGTGYSSLGYLHSLPVNFLKIDRSFVSQMDESREKYEIVNTIIKLAKNLKMMVIAEGIEEKEQLEILERLYCEFGQGYLFSKPLEADRARFFIEKSFKESEANRKKTVHKFQLTA